MLEDLVVWYLFLGGAGAGLLFALTILESLSPQATDGVHAEMSGRYVPREAYRRFFGPAYGAGMAAVLIGAVCLLLDLGRNDRALSIFLQPAPSFISVGAFALAFVLLLAAVLFAVWAFGIPSLTRTTVSVVRICCMIAALATMVYTGLFLSSMSAVPLWDSIWLPVLFVASALSTGLALLVSAVVLTGSSDEFETTLRRIQELDAAVIACELVVLTLFVAAGWFGSETAHLSVERMLFGDLSGAFWMGVVLLGLAVPVALEVLNRTSNAHVVIASSVLVLGGGYMLRWCISEAGMAPDIVASVMAVLGIQ